MLLLICFLVLSFVKLSTDTHKINIWLFISADSSWQWLSYPLPHVMSSPHSSVNHWEGRKTISDAFDLVLLISGAHWLLEIS